MIPHTYHLVAGWLASHPYVLGALGAAFVAGVGWAFHWWVLDVHYWFHPYGRPEDYPDPADWPERSLEHWDDMDADAQADQLIAEWHDDGPTVQAAMAGWWEDPDIIEWDIRQQVRRIREIRQELAALRLELAA